MTPCHSSGKTHKAQRNPCPVSLMPPRQECCPSPRRRYRPRTVSSLLATASTCAPSAKGMTNLSDILVAHSADLLDIGRTLRHVLEGVAKQDELVLLRLGDLDVDTGLEGDVAHNLLADEVTASPESASSWPRIPQQPQAPISVPHSQPLHSTLRLRPGKTYRISTFQRPVSAFLSTLTLMGKWA